MIYLATFLSLAFFTSAFGFFVVSAYRAKKRTNIKKELIAIDYEHYSDLLSQRMLPVLISENNRDNKFFRRKDWPGNIPEKIRSDLEKNLIVERIWLIVALSCPTLFVLAAIAVILIPV